MSNKIQCTYTSVMNIGFSSQHTVYTCSCYEYTRNCTVCISTVLFISIDMHSVSDLGFQTNRAHVHVDIRHNSCSRVRAGSGQVQLLHVDLHRSAYTSHVYLILTEYEVNIGNKSRVKDRGEAEVFYEVFISYTDQVRSQY